MVRGIEGHQFNDEELEDLYNEIRDNGYRIELTANVAAASKKGKKSEEKGANAQDRDVQRLQGAVQNGLVMGYDAVLLECSLMLMHMLRA